MGESTVPDRVQRALLAIPELDGWKVLLVSARVREDQLNSRTEIRSNIRSMLSRPDFDRGGAEGQVLTAVLEYFDGEKRGGL